MRQGFRPLRWSFRLSARTFNKFVYGNVGAFRPRFQRSSADRADRVTRMRHQELLFSASVLGAAIACSKYALGNVNLLSRAPTKTWPGIWRRLEHDLAWRPSLF